MAGAWRGPLEGGHITATINFIEHFGRVRGAAFPSEHVAGSVAALWGAWRHRRWLFWVMLPLVACMCVSTVWGRRSEERRVGKECGSGGSADGCRKKVVGDGAWIGITA